MRRGLFYNLKKHHGLYLMFLPVIVSLLVFNYVPMWGLVLAFKNYVPWKGFLGSRWVGLENFDYVFNTANFPQLLANTIVINLLKLFWGFPAPIIFALLLNELRRPGFKRPIQTISYLPHFVSWIVISSIAYNLFNVNFGILNNLLKSMGRDPIQWYLRADLWRSILVISSVWKGMGYGSILYLAAISSIDPTLYEAAVVDGAKRRQQLWHITLPSIMPTASVLFILSLGGIMYGDFGQIYALIGYNSPLYRTTDVLDFFIYRVGFQSGKYSIGIALGMFQSAVGCAMVMATNAIARRAGGTGIW